MDALYSSPIWDPEFLSAQSEKTFYFFTYSVKPQVLCPSLSRFVCLRPNPKYSLTSIWFASYKPNPTSSYYLLHFWFIMISSTTYGDIIIAHLPIEDTDLQLTWFSFNLHRSTQLDSPFSFSSLS